MLMASSEHHPSLKFDRSLVIAYAPDPASSRTLAFSPPGFCGQSHSRDECTPAVFPGCGARAVLWLSCTDRGHVVWNDANGERISFSGLFSVTPNGMKDAIGGSLYTHCQAKFGEVATSQLADSVDDPDSTDNGHVSKRQKT
eukprot:COSAG01_NODE_314_length_19013_cov_164.111240_3_plen_142_part_00